MSWDQLLGLTVLGSVTTFCIVAWVIQLGIRYRKELPKLPIHRSIQALELQRESLEEETEKKKDELFDAKKTIEEAEERERWMEEKREEVQQLRDDLQGLDGERQQLEDVRQERSEIDREVSELQTKKTALERELAELDARLEAQREQIERLEALKAEQALLEKQVPELKADLEATQRRLGEAKQELADLRKQHDTTLSEHIRLAAEVESLRKQHDSWLKMVEQVKTDYDAAGGSRDDQDPCEDLWKPVFPEPSVAREVSDTTEKNALEHLEAEIRRTNLQFARRTIYAFHTALKVQDISPLTVLAGISGTGKSLIPKVYSQAMGIRFLNLPVQPGWNSPLDLFGFYNYIEHKYKATPLSRAMVQFDGYHRKSWPLPADAPDLSEHMLLVLLDEMNLARIEYYFSELLSRLELRRTIDPNDSDQRREVSIPLEIGHGSTKYNSIAIYPGSNLLFTGTMNEDETTQSLADKVLDRACVLRFGRPKKMVTQAPSVQDLRAAEPLHRKRWQSWCTPEKKTTDIETQIQKLSEIMDSIGAPFGHRVSQGIRQYVALYPDNSETGRRHALADQIEQKMLPKIRGRELTQVADPLGRLLDLVRDLDDGMLEEAISKGRESDHGTFHWRGLDRNDAKMP